MKTYQNELDDINYQMMYDHYHLGIDTTNPEHALKLKRKEILEKMNKEEDGSYF